jgi:hypothetical protein
VHYKVKQGAAKVCVIHIIETNNEQITSINSFWDIDSLIKQSSNHPELKNIFNNNN